MYNYKKNIDISWEFMDLCDTLSVRFVWLFIIAAWTCGTTPPFSPKNTVGHGFCTSYVAFFPGFDPKIIPDFPSKISHGSADIYAIYRGLHTTIYI